ncbi:hypothetical protein [Alicycliphilus denitrificans]|uniref:hypothetical protein n=1 Tax=Alicycliphilus denitrificans TaxID=179636 RepID=UPI000C9FB397|nr:hypothetical protein [Alicycliphilus denitrificans]
MKEAAWIIAAVLTLGIGAIAGHEAEADKQDAEAMASREWAGRQACAPDATPEWLDDKTHRCLRNLDDALSVAGGRP